MRERWPIAVLAALIPINAPPAVDARVAVL
jgi:hypothetical protein